MNNELLNIVTINYFLDGFYSNISYRNMHVYRAICAFMNNKYLDGARIDSIYVNYSFLND